VVVPKDGIVDGLVVGAKDDGGMLLSADGDGSDSLKSGSTVLHHLGVFRLPGADGSDGDGDTRKLIKGLGGVGLPAHPEGGLGVADD
jgi:hypothetical protein